MTDFGPFVVVGLVTGSLYGLAAMGLVLTYKTSGVFNFAHGALATVAAYTFYELHIRRDMPWPIAAVIVVVVVGAALGVVFERLARTLTLKRPAMQIVATIGVLAVIQALAVAWWGAESRTVPAFLPTRAFLVAGANVGLDQIIVFLIAVGSATGLSLFFRWSKLGLSMQAVVDDPDLLATAGTSPVRVRTAAWMIGAVFACLSGVLLVPFVGLDATILTLLVAQAFGAAAVGGFSSLPLTYVGGLAIGVASALSTKYVGSAAWLAGFPSAVPFLTLFIVLLFLPNRARPSGAHIRTRSRSQFRGSKRSRTISLVCTAVALLAVPHFVGTRLPVYTSALIYVAIFLSLHLLIRTSGQVSLAHSGFAAVGAATFVHLAGTAHLPWLLALLVAGLSAVPIGAAIAVPAIRLSGLYLAISTFGFAILLEKLVYPTSLMFGGGGLSGLRAPRPGVWTLSGDTGYYYTVLLAVGALAALITLVTRTRLGRLLRALSDSPLALRTHGTNVNLTRLLVFCISAFVAGVSGALFAGLTRSVAQSTFTSFDSLEWLVVLVMAGPLVRYASLPTALIAAAAIAIVPSYFQRDVFHEYLPVVFGVAAICQALASDRPPKARRSSPTPEGDKPVSAVRRSPVLARAEAYAEGRERRPQKVAAR